MFPARNILTKTMLEFLPLKSLSRAVAVSTKQPVVNSCRQTPEGNRKSEDAVLEKCRAVSHAAGGGNTQYNGLLVLGDCVVPTAALACRNIAQQR